MDFSTDEIERLVYEDLKLSMWMAVKGLKGLVDRLQTAPREDDAVEMYKLFHSIRAIANHLDTVSVETLSRRCEVVMEHLGSGKILVKRPVVSWLILAQEQFARWSEDFEHNKLPRENLLEGLETLPPLPEWEGEVPEVLLSRLTVLYVEDEEGIRKSLSRYLKRRVKALWVAEDGKEGLAMYESHTPDIVITDITMPNVDGFEMVEAMRAQNPQLPVVFTTAHNEKPFIERSEKLSANGFLVKPFHYEMLEEELHVICKLYFPNIK